MNLWCTTSMENPIPARKCFITGEFCSKQTYIHQKRKEFHNEKEITAFVIMNFSDMSDILYNWRLKPYIESLKKYLLINQETSQIRCYREVKTANEAQNKYAHLTDMYAKVKQAYNAYKGIQSTYEDYTRLYHISSNKTKIRKLYPAIKCLHDTAYQAYTAVRTAYEKYETTFRQHESEWMQNEIKDIPDEEELVSTIIRYCEKADIVYMTCRKKYQEYDLKANLLRSSAASSDKPPKNPPSEKSNTWANESREIAILPPSPGKWEKVEKIKVVRADSDPSSNYIVCSRICQQMHIADLVIVDVSSPNPNVSYEFGMAAAMWKLILPICYKERYFPPIHPSEADATVDTWRNTLFECYRIRYQPKEHDTREPVAQGIQDTDSSSSQSTYSKDFVSAQESPNTLIIYATDGLLNEEQSGTCMVNFYENTISYLQEKHCFCGDRIGILAQDNQIHEPEKDTEDEQDTRYNVRDVIHIGVNQATYLTTGEMITPTDFMTVSEEDKRTTDEAQKNGRKLNQQYGITSDVRQYMKRYIRNRGILIYSNTAVSGQFQSMLEFLANTNEIVVDISKNNSYNLFWLGVAHSSDIYAIMVKHETTEKEAQRTTKGTVKKERNIFDVAGLWMAILRSNDTENFYKQLAMVQRGIERHLRMMIDDREIYEKNMQELLSSIDTKEEDSENAAIEGKTSNSRDSSAQWNITAGKMKKISKILTNKNTTERKRQKDITVGEIQKIGKVLTKKNSVARKRQKDITLGEIKNILENVTNKNYTDKKQQKDIIPGEIKPISEILTNKNDAERKRLESYYRRLFWNQMLRYNKLRIYTPEYDMMENGGGMEPRIYTASWDTKTISNISNYLSKRTVIGEYLFRSLKKGEDDREYAEKINFISVGDHANPLGYSLPWKIYKNTTDVTIHKSFRFPSGTASKTRKTKCLNENGAAKTGKLDNGKKYKGFRVIGKNKGLFSQHHTHICNPPAHGKSSKDGRILTYEAAQKAAESGTCQMYNTNVHLQLAQLILWREEAADGKEYFQVSIVGNSGPSTLGLSMLFIDEDQRTKQLPQNAQESPTSEYMLSELQLRIRQAFIREYSKKIYEKLKKSPHDGYAALIVHSAELYLSTVLYRYFLPILSAKNIQTIKQGMHAFFHAMQMDNRGLFMHQYSTESYITESRKTQIVTTLTDELENCLKSFRGVEAFFGVEVQCLVKKTPAISGRQDDRKVLGIQMVTPSEYGHSVNCLFTENKAVTTAPLCDEKTPKSN